MKGILNYIYKHCSVISALTVAFFLILLSSFFLFGEVLPRYIPSEALKSDTAPDEKRLENREDIIGVFTYGPYISLKKGKYDITVFYSSTEKRDLQFTSGFGSEIIASENLPATQNGKKTMRIKLSKDVDDNSFEMRTFYEGKGLFEISGVSVRKLNVNFAALAFLLCFALTVAAIYKLFYISEKIRLALIFYIGVLCSFLYFSLGQTFSGLVITAVLFSVMLFMLHYRIKRLHRLLRSRKIVTELFCALLCAYLFCTAVTIPMNEYDVNVIGYVSNINKSGFMLMLVLSFNLIVMLRFLFMGERFIYMLTQLSAALAAIQFVVGTKGDIFYCAGIVIIFALVTFFLHKESKSAQKELFLSKKAAFIAVTSAFTVFVFYLSIITVCRYRSYCSNTFDMGIFTQMYEYMARSLLPLTTVERNVLLSHFYIHFSPVYYLLLPGYYIFRCPEYLLVMQAIFVGAGVFPLFFICADKSKNCIYALMVSLAYLCAPGILAPLFYDFHENAFLPFMLLSLLYFQQKKKYLLMYLFMAATLLIKEDAAIYVLAVALFTVFAEKKYKHGLIMLAFSALYFTAVMIFISRHGQGLMDSHYALYYLSGEGGVVSMFTNMFFAPGVVLDTCFNSETAAFVLYTLGTLLFIPLAGRKTANLWLIVPYFLLNLITDYPFQHDVGYQYVFGTTALLFFLYAYNIYRFPKKSMNIVLTVTLLACICGTYTKTGDLNYYINYYNSSIERFNDNDRLLSKIPADVSVTASSSLTAHLSRVEKLYDYPYYDNKTDCYVLCKNDEGYEDFSSGIKKKGYKLKEQNEDIAVYYSPELGSNKK